MVTVNTAERLTAAKEKVKTDPCFPTGLIDLRTVTRQSCSDFFNKHSACLQRLITATEPTDESPFRCLILGDDDYGESSHNILEPSKFKKFGQKRRGIPPKEYQDAQRLRTQEKAKRYFKAFEDSFDVYKADLEEEGTSISYTDYTKAHRPELNSTAIVRYSSIESLDEVELDDEAPPADETAENLARALDEQNMRARDDRNALQQSKSEVANLQKQLLLQSNQKTPQVKFNNKDPNDTQRRVFNILPSKGRTGDLEAMGGGGSPPSENESEVNPANQSWNPNPTNTDWGLMLEVNPKSAYGDQESADCCAFAKYSQNNMLRAQSKQYEWGNLVTKIIERVSQFDRKSHGTIYQFLSNEVKSFLESLQIPNFSKGVLLGYCFGDTQRPALNQIINAVLTPYLTIEKNWTLYQTRMNAKDYDPSQRLDYKNSQTDEEVVRTLEGQRFSNLSLYGELFFEISSQIDTGIPVSITPTTWKADGLRPITEHFQELIFNDKVQQKQINHLPINNVTGAAQLARCLTALLSGLHKDPSPQSEHIINAILTDKRLDFFWTAGKNGGITEPQQGVAGIYQALTLAHVKGKSLANITKIEHHPKRASRNSLFATAETTPREVAYTLQTDENQAIPNANSAMEETRRKLESLYLSQMETLRPSATPRDQNEQKYRSGPFRDHLQSTKYGNSALTGEKPEPNPERQGTRNQVRKRARDSNWAAVGRSFENFKKAKTNESLYTFIEAACLELVTNPLLETEEEDSIPPEEAGAALQSVMANLDRIPRVLIVNVDCLETPTGSFSCLVDTGATINIIRYDMLFKLNLLGKKTRLAQEVPISTCGGEIRLRDIVTIKVKIGKLELGSQVFHIVPKEYLGRQNSTLEGILGEPALSMCGFTDFFHKWFSQVSGESFKPVCPPLLNIEDSKGDLENKTGPNAETSNHQMGESHRAHIDQKLDYTGQNRTQGPDVCLKKGEELEIGNFDQKCYTTTDMTQQFENLQQQMALILEELQKPHNKETEVGVRNTESNRLDHPSEIENPTPLLPTTIIQNPTKIENQPKIQPEADNPKRPSKNNAKSGEINETNWVEFENKIDNLVKAEKSLHFEKTLRLIGRDNSLSEQYFQGAGPKKDKLLLNERLESATERPLNGVKMSRINTRNKKIRQAYKDSEAQGNELLHTLLKEREKSALTFPHVEPLSGIEKDQMHILTRIAHVPSHNRVNLLKLSCLLDKKDVNWSKKSILDIKEAISGYRWTTADHVLTEEETNGAFPPEISFTTTKKCSIPPADVRDVDIRFPEDASIEGISYVTSHSLLNQPGVDIPSRLVSTAGGPNTSILVMNHGTQTLVIPKGTQLVAAQAVRHISTSRLDSENYLAHTSPLTDYNLAEILATIESIYSERFFKNVDLSKLERDAQARYTEISESVKNPLEELKNGLIKVEEGRGMKGEKAVPEVGKSVREAIDLILGGEGAFSSRQMIEATNDEIKIKNEPLDMGTLITSDQTTFINALDVHTRRSILEQLDKFEQSRFNEFVEILRPLEEPEVVRLLIQFAHRFYGDRAHSWEMITTDPEVVQIPLKANIPECLNPNYSKKLNPSELEAVNDFLCANLARGVLRRSKSNHINPILLVKKPNNRGYRICLDFRKANEEIFDSSSHMVPLITDMILKMGNAELFSCFDVSNAYYRVTLPERYRKYCAFQVPKGPYTGLWEFCVLPFGVKPAVSIFSQIMDKSLRGLQYRNLLWYLDDILIYTELPKRLDHLTGTERHQALVKIHVEQMKLFLRRSTTYNLTYSIEKVHFLKKSIEFLGFIIGNGTICPSPKTKAKLDAIRRIGRVEAPLKAWQRVMGFFNYCSANIPGFASQRKLVMKLHGKFEEYCRDNRSLLGREKLRQIAQPSIDRILEYWCWCVNFGKLIIPKANTPLRLYTDASKRAIGFVLTTENHEIVWFGSRVLKDAELNYHIEELEVLALNEGLMKVKVYSVRASVLLVNLDNRNHIRAMLSFQTPPATARLSKFLGQLRNYGELDITYVQSDKQVADLFTRDCTNLEEAGEEALTATENSLKPPPRLHKELFERGRYYRPREKTNRIEGGGDPETTALPPGTLSPIDSGSEAECEVDTGNEKGEICFSIFGGACDVRIQRKIEPRSFPRMQRARMVEGEVVKTLEREWDATQKPNMTDVGSYYQAICAVGPEGHLKDYQESLYTAIRDITEDVAGPDWLEQAWDPRPENLKQGVRTVQNAMVKGDENGQGHHCFSVWPLAEETVELKWDPQRVVKLSENELFEIRSYPGYVSKEDKIRLVQTLHAAYYCRLKGQNLNRLLLLWFPGLSFTRTLVQNVLDNCQNCQLNIKMAHTSSCGEIAIPTRPWQQCSIDHYQYKNYNQGIFRYILTVKCDFSKQVVFVPVRSKHIREAWVALDVIFVTTGKPETIRADNAFRSQEFTQWSALRDYYLQYSPPYRPQANGMIERVHNDINKLMPLVLDAMCLEPNDWVWAINEVARLINHTPSTTHGYPPDMVCKGYLTDETFMYTRTEKLCLSSMWEKIYQRLHKKRQLHLNPHSRPEGKDLKKGTVCWLKVPGRELEQVEILIDLGSTVLCNKLSLPQGHRYRCLVIHKEFLRYKVHGAQAPQQQVNLMGVEATWGIPIEYNARKGSETPNRGGEVIMAII